MHRLPATALLLGIAGLIPFVGCGLLAAAVDDPERARRAVAALTTYGAVILAFLGGVHWGFVLASPTGPPPRAASARLVLGTIPSLIGWVAATMTFILPPEFGLALLIVGFAATVLAEAAMRRRGLVPDGYMALRWGLSAVVILTLAAVLASRLLGLRVAI